MAAVPGMVVHNMVVLLSFLALAGPAEVAAHMVVRGMVVLPNSPALASPVVVRGSARRDTLLVRAQCDQLLVLLTQREGEWQRIGVLSVIAHGVAGSYGPAQWYRRCPQTTCGS